jgi:hypothetical protein
MAGAWEHVAVGEAEADEEWRVEVDEATAAAEAESSKVSETAPSVP